MKVSKVLLRWFKSFNTNYVGYPERRQEDGAHPWNRLRVQSDNEDDYRFIEIPIERDITTVIGANESGKSHLLDAISKVIRGTGIEDARSDGSAFAQTDLCHFCKEQTRNIEAWPNIGLQFCASEEEYQAILSAAGVTTPRPRTSGKKRTPIAVQEVEAAVEKSFTLIIAPIGHSADNHEAFLYYDTDDQTNPKNLTSEQLKAVRRLLPQIQFIKSDVALASEIPLTDLIQSYKPGTEATPAFDFSRAQRALQHLQSLSLPGDDGTTSAEGAAVSSATLAEKEPETADLVAQVRELRSMVHAARIDSSNGMVLERQLFEHVLDIRLEALVRLSEIPIENRSSADQIVDLWNRQIEEQLRLSRFWQQDEAFTLSIDYKQGILHFEITDRTKAKYTFRERSSGLRFFLSYYIQAKALEATRQKRDCIIMMDEPDSFLSILGQQNLLAVFESLVAADSSRQNTQLIYTTHSPYLINRNFPRRLRLVRKGYAEEGTQYIHGDKAIRRYEPARSALNVETSQTLFMGATNLVLEGPVDQYLLAECIRIFANPDNLSNYLDLNSVVLISAGTASRIEPLISASQWGNEPMPATGVLLDDDKAGRDACSKITGQEPDKPSLIDRAYVRLV